MKINVIKHLPARLSAWFLSLTTTTKVTLLLLLTVFLTLQLLFICCLPEPLFRSPYSLVVLDKDGCLAGAKIAADGQWRFPETQHLSDKFKACITLFEDKRFYTHLGVDVLALVRAAYLNVRAAKIVSGGSTLTMQTIRLSRHGRPRTFGEKIVEAFLALRLETKYTKDEILCLYASHAPFGGNVVGIDAAAWRYFGRPPDKLSWSENAFLAVLPNNPTNINTAKNRLALKHKRDRLLCKLHDNHVITATELALAVDEDLPLHPSPYPTTAYHFVNRVAADMDSARNSLILTTLDLNLQNKISDIVEEYSRRYSENHIDNLACLVLDVATGNVLAYVGNAGFASGKAGSDIDMIMAKRSTGSILKPFLYAAMLTEGELLPQELLRDVPVNFGSFSPENFSKNYTGAIAADRALAQSLNVPFVLLLHRYGVFKFLHILQRLGFASIDKDARYYGLSLILGGAEATLWEICSAYASVARSLAHFAPLQSRYNAADFHPAQYAEPPPDTLRLRNANFLSAAAIWFAFEAMTTLVRPDEEQNWQRFSSTQKIAWKTGTSFGHKDAWSVGVTPNYVVGVWVGNASGEGRKGVVGLNVAAPVLFAVVRCLHPASHWFDMPVDDMIWMPVCKTSGMLASDNCPDVDTMPLPANAVRADNCHYHTAVFLDQSGRYRVDAQCYPRDSMQPRSWFVLPPAMEMYFKQRNPWYVPLPPKLPACDQQQLNDREVMELEYPTVLSRVFIPVDIAGDTLPVVFKLAHRNQQAQVYWYVDGQYLGTTKYYHEQEIRLHAGNYTLFLVDDEGNTLSRKFAVVSK